MQRLFPADEKPPQIPLPTPRAGEVHRRFEEPQPRAASTGAYPQRMQQPLPREPDAPVIHVSIGRIDVRAVAPAEKPQPKARPPLAPRLSLDDYLRRRDGDR
jgi:hypothetical protein